MDAEKSACARTNSTLRSQIVATRSRLSPANRGTAAKVICRQSISTNASNNRMKPESFSKRGKPAISGTHCPNSPARDHGPLAPGVTSSTGIDYHNCKASNWVKAYAMQRPASTALARPSIAATDRLPPATAAGCETWTRRWPAKPQPIAGTSPHTLKFEAFATGKAMSLPLFACCVLVTCARCR